MPVPHGRVGEQTVTPAPNRVKMARLEAGTQGRFQVADAPAVTPRLSAPRDGRFYSEAGKGFAAACGRAASPSASPDRTGFATQDRDPGGENANNVTQGRGSAPHMPAKPRSSAGSCGLWSVCLPGEAPGRPWGGVGSPRGHGVACGGLHGLPRAWPGSSALGAWAGAPVAFLGDSLARARGVWWSRQAGQDPLSSCTGGTRLREVRVWTTWK